MLFILTGDIQIGKTRWLQQLVRDLEAIGVTPYGVTAPGTWIEHTEDDGKIRYEKTGIDNELLPNHERIAFARRHDLARKEGTYDTQSQAAQMKLSWAIDDNAIAAVNAHLDVVAKRTANRDINDTYVDTSATDKPNCSSGETDRLGTVETAATGSPSHANISEVSTTPGLLVIDELGRLELLAGNGLVSALALIDRGATAALLHALIIVRDQLLETAQQRFANAPWGGIMPIAPNAEAHNTLLEAYGATN